MLLKNAIKGLTKLTKTKSTFETQKLLQKSFQTTYRHIHSLRNENSKKLLLNSSLPSSTLFSTLQSSTHHVFHNFSTNNKELITLHFILPSGEKTTTTAPVGKNILDVVLDNNIDVDGFGACEGTLACSTCHVVFSKEDFNSIGKEACDEELDMLDLAFGLTPTSRLGCQIVLTKEMDGWVIEVPTSVDAR